MSATALMEKYEKTLVIPSDPDAIAQVEEFIDQISAELDVRDDVYGNIMLCVTEAVNNGVLHGNACDPAKQVRVRVRRRGAFVLEIVVEDEGPGFNPNDPKFSVDPTSEENLLLDSGRGVFLMRTLADSLDYEDAGRRVVMTFNI